MIGSFRMDQEQLYNLIQNRLEEKDPDILVLKRFFKVVGIKIARSLELFFHSNWLVDEESPLYKVEDLVQMMRLQHTMTNLVFLRFFHYSYLSAQPTGNRYETRLTQVEKRWGKEVHVPYWQTSDDYGVEIVIEEGVWVYGICFRKGRGIETFTITPTSNGPQYRNTTPEELEAILWLVYAVHSQG